MTSFTLNYLFKESVSKHSHTLRCWEVGLPHVHLEGGRQSMTDYNIALCVQLLFRGREAKKERRQRSYYDVPNLAHYFENFLKK